ncbi:MAG: outer membrane protein transport protein, partial [Planctomycetota bacterium]|nr:outer membrane protein transport protein [Planctomycetota bacterium]
PAVLCAQGIVIPGVGPINRSMGGAAVAAPLDAAGAIQWNPATLSGLETSEAVLGVELLYLSTYVSSTVVGVGSGENRSDSGVSPLPTVAISLHNEESPWTLGLGLFSIGGFGVNYPASLTNPVLAPRTLHGAGNVYSRLQVLQLVPTAALQVNERLSVGFAPTVSMADAALDPGAVASGYIPATHGRVNWGLGFQAGMYYVTDSCWHFGLSYKSPQWFETFNFNSTTALPGDAPHLVQLNIDYPSITSLGMAYYGVPGLIWDVDLRYVDYAQARLFGGAPGFDFNGNLTGLGWRSVFSVATGVQYQWTEALSLRLGYVYTDNPIPANLTAINIAAPAIYQHILSMGATLRVTCRTSFSLAYLHAFESAIEGPLPGPPPGIVGTRQYIDAMVAGMEVKF